MILTEGFAKFSKTISVSDIEWLNSNGLIKAHKHIEFWKANTHLQKQTLSHSIYPKLEMPHKYVEYHNKKGKILNPEK